MAKDDNDDNDDEDAVDNELETVYQSQTGSTPMDQTPEPAPEVLDYNIKIISFERSDVRTVHDFGDGKPYTCSDGQRGEGIGLYFTQDEKVG